MKKNRMMRLASGLLVAVLATTSMISGTYAKYVTQDSANDTARVAKWGVTALVSGSLFGEHYNDTSVVETSNKVAAEITGSVDTSVSNENIVAPGTKSDKGLRLAVTGKPEVKAEVNVSVDAAAEYENIWLAEGKYGVMVKVDNHTADNFAELYTYDTVNNVYTKATGSYDGTKIYYKLIDEAEVSAAKITDGRFHTTDARYYPVIWYVTDGETVSSHLKVEDLGTHIDNQTEFNDQYDDNVDLSTTVGYIDITWEWPFESTTLDGVDGADTILGDMIAYANGTSNYQVVRIDGTTITGVKVANGEAKAGSTTVANLEVGFNAKVTVTQVD